jgi:hypothetical protein
MTRPRNPDPLLGTERLLVDGSNLLYALGRGRAGPAPAATLIGRLRAVVPPGVRIEIVFDGPPEPGLRGTRIASGLTVRHSGRATADSLIEHLVAEGIGGGGTVEAAHSAGAAILVVSDDIALGSAVRRRGGRTVGTAWLIRRLERGALSAPAAGARRRPIGPAPGQSTAVGDEDDDALRWRPGRGATRKTGNPRRGRRRQENRPG